MKKVVIDPGHGGEDPGAVANNLVEKDINLEISKIMYDKLKEEGVDVSITRDTDETLSSTERVDRILSFYGNSPDVVVVSNHVNAGGGDGAEVIYALRDTDELSNRILNSINLTGQNIRDAFQRRLPSDPSKDYYFIHRETGVTEPVIIEYGFVDSPIDDVAQLTNNKEALALAATNAILEYIGIDVVQEGFYKVQTGDSLWSIAKKFNTTVDEIKEVNNLTSNLLSVGQSLKIPTVEEDFYIVKAGDTLYSIARDLNITVDELKKLNNLTSNTLSIGQKLNVITLEEPTDYVSYTVQKGDSLYSIARRYNTTVQSLVDYNNLSSTILDIGDTIKIPTATTGDDIIYTVKSGDNLYSIARDYGITVTRLREYNNLTSDLLSIGQTIRIPGAKTDIEPNGTTDTTDIIYTVKPGDNLYSIASDYNTTVTRLKDYNGLTSNTLSIGQTLKIPTGSSDVYIVASGDNLYSIARKFNTTVDNIKQLNNLTSNTLSIGQELIIA